MIAVPRMTSRAGVQAEVARLDHDDGPVEGGRIAAAGLGRLAGVVGQVEVVADGMLDEDEPLGPLLLHESACVEERGVVACGSAFVAADGGIGDGGRRFDDEPEMRRHLIGIARIVGHR